MSGEPSTVGMRDVSAAVATFQCPKHGSACEGVACVHTIAHAIAFERARIAEWLLSRDPYFRDDEIPADIARAIQRGEHAQ